MRSENMLPNSFKSDAVSQNLQLSISGSFHLCLPFKRLCHPLKALDSK